jgi:hypothetical protein
MFKGIRRLSEMTKIIRFSGEAATASLPQVNLFFGDRTAEVKQACLCVYVGFLASRQNWKHHSLSEINFEVVHHIFRGEYIHTEVDRVKLIDASFKHLVKCIGKLNHLADLASTDSVTKEDQAKYIHSMLLVILKQCTGEETRFTFNTHGRT